MARQRSALRGGTDYTGVSLKDIYEHLREWRDSTQALIQKLTEYKSQATENKNRLDHAEDINHFIDISIDLFKRFLSDYDRLLVEIPKGITDAHIEILAQIISRSDYHEDYCVRFKNEHIEKSLRDESMRPLLDNIYAETRDEIINYSDLHNVIPRLKTYIGIKLKQEDNHGLTIDDTEAIELKPNIFGIGLNLNYIIKRLKQLFMRTT
jgi:DNA-binding transcriptional MerR regulator